MPDQQHPFAGVTEGTPDRDCGRPDRDPIHDVETDRVDAELERRFNELREAGGLAARPRSEASPSAAVEPDQAGLNARVEFDVILSLAQLLHECARPAVEARKVVRSDIPVMPFQDWTDLSDEARDGRLLMSVEFLRLFGLRAAPVQFGIAHALTEQLVGNALFIGPHEGLGTFVAASLAAARGLQTGERNERNRHLAIAVTELEKVEAWVRHRGL